MVGVHSLTTSCDYLLERSEARPFGSCHQEYDLNRLETGWEGRTWSLASPAVAVAAVTSSCVALPWTDYYDLRWDDSYSSQSSLSPSSA